ncbi:hypothetical protein WJU23_17375 [Prosthecobacter sp. SYSU 5D2]|uniref:hypothetical protein n=1 Tax=Prosthecobacter sp. SYSU 5D2 TaxID=3134134 RepID=UPI0031FE541C
MLFSTVLMWLLIAAGFVIALPALWLLARGLWPETVARQREVASRGLLKCFLLGLVPLTGSIVLIIVLSKLPKMGALAVLLGGIIVAWGFIGAGGIAALIGERLWPEAAPWRQTKQGGLALVLCALLPVVGWVVLLPLIAILGWGIALRASFMKAPQPAPATPVLPAVETASA